MEDVLNGIICNTTKHYFFALAGADVSCSRVSRQRLTFAAIWFIPLSGIKSELYSDLTALF